MCSAMTASLNKSFNTHGIKGQCNLCHSGVKRSGVHDIWRQAILDHAPKCCFHSQYYVREPNPCVCVCVCQIPLVSHDHEGYGGHVCHIVRLTLLPSIGLRDLLSPVVRCTRLWQRDGQIGDRTWATTFPGKKKKMPHMPQPIKVSAPKAEL